MDEPNTCICYRRNSFIQTFELEVNMLNYLSCAFANRPGFGHRSFDNDQSVIDELSEQFLVSRS